MKVVISEFLDEAALGGFPAEWSIVYDPGLVDERTELLAELHDADAIVVRNRTQVNAELLKAAPKLKVVGRLGVGLDNINLGCCSDSGVIVKPAIGANTRSVAEYVIGAAMSLIRGAYTSNAAMLAGEWPRGPLGQGGEISGKVMGLWGFGGIARAVAARARAMGMDVIAFDPFVAEDDPAWEKIEPVDREALLARADVISLHVPLTSETKDMIGAEAIAAMKSSAILINTARGGVVDEAALAAALKSGDLGGAALDVFAEEPLTAEAAAVFEGAPNLILTPHIAGVTAEANSRVSHITVKHVVTVLGG